MKRNIAAFILLASVGAFSLRAQSARPELFDTRKSQQELEIMRGIIGTTLDFAARETSHDERGRSTGRSGKLARLSWGGHGVEAYYFYGQGATFLVPMSGVRFSVFAELNDQFADMENEIEAAQEKAFAEATSAYALADAALASTPAPPAPAAQPAPPQPPRPPKPPTPAVAATPRPAAAPAASREDARKRLAEAQEQVKKRREMSQERRKELLETVERAKGYLVEAVANHGDSLTFLKPNEYINVVLSTDGGDLLGESESGSSGRQIISVQKSTITDYKAGRLSLDAFKQKVLQYTN